IENDVARVDLDHGVRKAADDGRVKICGVEKAGKYRLAGGILVDRESREFTDAGARHPQCVDFFPIEIVGGQTPVRIEPNAHGAYQLTLVIRDEGRKLRILRAHGNGVSPSGVAPLDQLAGFAAAAAQLRDAYLEAAVEASWSLQCGKVRLGDSKAA